MAYDFCEEQERLETKISNLCCWFHLAGARSVWLPISAVPRHGGRPAASHTAPAETLDGPEGRPHAHPEEGHVLQVVAHQATESSTLSWSVLSQVFAMDYGRYQQRFYDGFELIVSWFTAQTLNHWATIPHINSVNKAFNKPGCHVRHRYTYLL